MIDSHIYLTLHFCNPSSCRFYDIVVSFIENQDDAVVDLEADVQSATISVRQFCVHPPNNLLIFDPIWSVVI